MCQEYCMITVAWSAQMSVCFTVDRGKSKGLEPRVAEASVTAARCQVVSQAQVWFFTNHWLSYVSL